MIFEIINPSDHYTLESDSHEAACLACCLLGHGRYALRGVDTELECPLFIFGGHDEWFKGTFGADFEACLERNKPAIADAMESVVIGNRTDYLEALRLIDDPDKRKEWIASWNERHRSSMNNIGGRAVQYAEAIREQLAEAQAVESE